MTVPCTVHKRLKQKFRKANLLKVSNPRKWGSQGLKSKVLYSATLQGFMKKQNFRTNSKPKEEMEDILEEKM
jgi:hypothetical protein